MNRASLLAGEFSPVQSSRDPSLKQHAKCKFPDTMPRNGGWETPSGPPPPLLPPSPVLRAFEVPPPTEGGCSYTYTDVDVKKKGTEKTTCYWSGSEEAGSTCESDRNEKRGVKCCPSSARVGTVTGMTLLS